MEPLDITGKKIGKVTAIKFSHKHPISNAHFWVFKCDCGKVWTSRKGDFLGGKVKSSRCENLKGRTHNMDGTPLYNVWLNMRQRTTNKKSTHYARYGGRGIKVCERWNRFENFLEDMGSTYKEGLTIDRYPDNNGDYSKENCRWATMAQQNRNKSSNRIIIYKGKAMCLAEWAKELGMNYGMLNSRLNRDKMTVEQAFETPLLKIKEKNNGQR